MSDSRLKRTKRALVAMTARMTARLLRRPRLTAEQLLQLEPRRILIVRQHNQMGDMICATPAFRAIAESYPQAKLALVTAPVNGDVVRHNPDLDQVFSFEQRFWRRPWQLLSFLRAIRTFRPDLAFVLGSVSFSITSAAIAAASGARWIVGADSRPFGWDLSRHAFSLEMPSQPEVTTNAVEHSLAPLASLGITTTDLSTVVVPAAAEEQAAEDFLTELGWAAGFWCLHPGAGKKQNLWPADRFAEIARRALSLDRRVLVLQGPADTAVLRRLSEAIGEPPATLCAPLQDSATAGSEYPDDHEVATIARYFVAPVLPVGVCAALLKRADRLLCNDTGIMHVAGALGVPTLALFGPTDPVLWKPPVPQVVALRAERPVADSRGAEFGWLENLDVVRVWSVLAALPGAYPGVHPAVHPAGNPDRAVQSEQRK